MSPDQYTAFAQARSAWFALPAAERATTPEPQLADFTAPADPLEESPQSERAAKPTKKPATK